MIWVSWGMETFHLVVPSYVTHSRGLRRREKRLHLTYVTPQSRKRKETTLYPLLSFCLHQLSRLMLPEQRGNSSLWVRSLYASQWIRFLSQRHQSENRAVQRMWTIGCTNTLSAHLGDSTQTQKKDSRHHSEECMSWKGMRMWIGATVDLTKICFCPCSFEKKE